MTERLVVITTDNEVSVREMENKDDSTLEGLHEIVGGYIEIVYPSRLPNLAMVINDEGAIRDLPVNVGASYLYGADIHGNYIFGDVAICACGSRNEEPDLVGLCDDLSNEIVEWLKRIIVFTNA